MNSEILNKGYMGSLKGQLRGERRREEGRGGKGKRYMFKKLKEGYYNCIVKKIKRKPYIRDSYQGEGRQNLLDFVCERMASCP